MATRHVRLSNSFVVSFFLIKKWDMWSETETLLSIKQESKEANVS